MRLGHLVILMSVVAGGCGGGGKGEAITTPTEAPETSETRPPTGTPAEGLIPRAVFFGNPDRASVKLSPDGKLLSWLAPEGGVMNVFVAPVGQLDQARAVTADTTRPVRVYGWAFDNRHIVYQQDTGGDEDWHVYAVDVATRKAVDLTPFPKVAAQLYAVSPRHPGVAVIGINDRNPQLHDVYRVELATGKRTLVAENPGYVGFSFDEDLALRTASQMTPDGGMKVVRPATPATPATPIKAWTDFYAVGPDDMLTTGGLAFDRTGRTQYMIDSRGRDTAALVALDTKTGKTKLLAEDPRADGSDVLIHPTTRKVEAVAFTYDRTRWQILDKQVGADLDALAKVVGADVELEIASRTLDDRTWVVAAIGDRGPVRYYLWDREAKKETFLFTNRKALEGLELAAMHAREIPARDGLTLVSYLSLPLASDPDGDGKPDRALPMVLLVHGGPWARDDWGYNPIHQLLASRGYAVLSVNFRGSTGFGKKFINAANREWAGKMHDDLLDAVAWATAQGVADPKRVAIMGGSYGGYATLVGLTFTPDVFACGVDIVGPSSIATLLSTIPPYWKPMLDLFTVRVGSAATPEGKRDLDARSPLHKVDAIARPLLIGQGANDPRVKQAESDQIVKAMTAKRIPVTYVLFPDEGHGFARPENNLAFFAIAEAFLSAHLGGVFQPLDAAAFAGSSVTVPSGAAGVPGLAAALAK